MRGAALLVTLAVAPVPAEAAPIPGSTRQLVVVLAEAWTSTQAKLQRWERSDRGRWRTVGAAIDVVLGKAGLGWGEGEGEPRKREGDGRSPAGVFAFDGGFGEQKVEEARVEMRVPGDRYLCVDDPAAADYNRIVEAAKAGPHASAERLHTSDEQYALGLVVAYNRAPIVPGRGSCIFLHVWVGERIATVGCTAMARASLEEIVRWLDPAAAPRIVQLPRAAYRARKKAWGLP